MATLAANALTSVADVKESLGIDSGVTTHNNMIIRLINAASDAIENYCNKTFASTVYTDEKYEGTGTNLLTLREYPVTTLSSISYLVSDYADDNWETLDTAFYTVDLDNGRVYANSAFNWFTPPSAGFVEGRNNWRVTYTAGYSATPDDVAEACVDLVIYNFNKRKASGIKSEKLGEYSVEWFPKTNSSVIKELGLDDVLDAYRTPSVI